MTNAGKIRFLLLLLALTAAPLLYAASETPEEEVTSSSEEFRVAHRMLQPLPVQRMVTVFGSARISEGDIAKDVEKLGALLAAKNYAVITGGGPGLMDAANRGAFQAGGTSIGMTIDLSNKKFSEYLNCHVPFRHFFARKTCMINYACAIVVCPGGFGTLDELFETLTLIQTRKINKIPVVLLNRKYWEGMRQWILDTLLENRTISEKDPELFFIADTPEEAVDYIVSRHREGIVRAGLGYPEIR